MADSDSDMIMEDADDPLNSYKRKDVPPSRRRRSTPSRSPGLFVSSKQSTPEAQTRNSSAAPERRAKRLSAVVIPPIEDKDGYELLDGEDTVRKVLREVDGTDEVMYEVRFGDTRTELVPFERLITLDNGSAALESYNNDAQSSEDENQGSAAASSDEDMFALRRNKRSAKRDPGFTDFSNVVLSSDDDELAEPEVTARRAKGRPRLRLTLSGSSRSMSRISLAPSEASSSAESDDEPSNRRSGRRLRQKNGSRATRSSTATNGLRRSSRNVNAVGESEDESESESSDDGDIPYLQSDVLPKSRKRKRAGRGESTKLVIRGMNFDKSSRANARRSERSTRHQKNMEEAGIDDIYRSDSDPAPANAAPKITVGTREIFKQLSYNDPFRLRHCQGCDTCGNGTNNGPLVYCQGCTLSYHKGCLGHRTGREHVVTKIGDGDFVLQCRRCVNAVRKREHTVPVQSKCTACNVAGPACRPFRERKTALQEQKERDENDGEDPITEVDPSLVNNVANVLFRCRGCWRAFHFHHLPPRSVHHMDIDNMDEDELAEKRFGEYARDWKCKDCVDMPAKVAGLIAWRPTDVETYRAGFTAEMMDEDEKEYLIKWDNLSYFRATWMPGPWVWGVTAPAMRKAFAKKENGPKMRTEDAIPEEYLRIDIVLDVKYTSIVETRAEEVDKARIKEVDKALIKYKGLGYEDAVWEKVPTPEEGDRWTDFVTAYNDWVLGKHIHIPKRGPLAARLEKVRQQDFSKLEKKKQPDNLIGGELMKYQMDGLNWLYYQWHQKKNGILADEMGLGKTIQVIGFMATLVQDHNCFPFLVVVPNSTCANWRREIKQWAPSLRVVTYFGSSTARAMAYQYEMYPEGSKDLRCHVVVTSYDAAADPDCRKFFKSVPWAGLIVDEGQRLKSDRSLLYDALKALKIPTRILMTGTPLQNNARELFNLLQFLDDNIDAAALEEEYADMTTENILKLHDLIRPFILRRTKAQVLTFLPPMAQIIVPVSMSVLQRKTYKAILAKSPDLLRAIFSTDRALKPTEKSNLSNILMQLRKCLCHPFVYNREIEERSDIAALSHRNLVEASSKLQLLEIMLPKLKERGHRVLIFSQFLNMLDIIEDFLDGLEMRYQRLDGTMGSLEKQKRIDEFNAPDSPLFAFLLSTRAGGVGINLATADTVIILDPDFNPHQDIQALSRAHRIGQKKKVLCFQLMTCASAEEKIVQIGRKKMALDHVVVEQLDAEDLEDRDLESVLRHGAAELFKEDENAEQEIRYDAVSVDKLLDRSQVENTKTGDDRSAETQFSFARVWANDQGALEDSLNATEEEEAPDPTVWDRILKERERAAAAAAAAREQALGRGKRARMAVDYATNERDAAGDGQDGIDGVDGVDGPDAEAEKLPVDPIRHRRRRKNVDDSDTDFMAAESEGEESIEEDGEPIDPNELQIAQRSTAPGGIAAALQDTGPKPTFTIRNPAVKPFTRAKVPPIRPILGLATNAANLHPGPPPPPTRLCYACQHQHAIGSCPLKIAGAEHCPLCGLAHFGYARTCPHFGSETQVREMLEALKASAEPRHLVDAATKYLKGLKGHIVQKKRRERERAMDVPEGVGVSVPGATIPVEERLLHAFGQG